MPVTLTGEWLTGELSIGPGFSTVLRPLKETMNWKFWQKKSKPKRGKRICTCCGKLLTVRVNGVIFKHKCQSVIVEPIKLEGSMVEVSVEKEI